MSINDHLKSEINSLEKLPFATMVMVLGIVSVFGCFCMGFTGLIAGIIALILYRKDRIRYIRQPDKYFEYSFNNLKNGHVLALIGLSLSSIFLLIIALMIIVENQNYILSFPWNLLR
jgi:hypothetical protein